LIITQTVIKSGLVSEHDLMHTDVLLIIHNQRVTNKMLRTKI